MAEEAKTAPVEESKVETTPVEPTPEAPKEEPKQEATVGEVLEPTDPAEPKTEPKVVPESQFLKVKNKNKELLKEIEALKKAKEEGAAPAEVSADLEALAEKHGVTPEFLKDLAEYNRKQTEDEVEGKMKPITDREKAVKIDKAFNEHYAKTLELMPEYKDLVNKDIIKNLSLDPKNRNKTFPQLLEEAYGHLVTGKRTLDAPSARTSRNDTGEVDYDRATKDKEYFKEVMANPMLKKKYNDTLTNRISRTL